MYKVVYMGTRNNDEHGAGYHEHSYWEFVYCTAGYATVICGNKELGYRANNLICIPPNTAHSEIIYENISNIYFLTDIGDALEKKLSIYEDFDMHEMETLVMQLRYHYHRRSKNWQNVNSAIISLIVELIRAKGPVDDTELFIEMAESTIIANLTDSKFDINRIYENVPMAKVYFASLFKKVTGMSPVEYLTDKRIENAKSLLREREATGNTIADIANMSGFDDIYYFSRVFKKVTGYSPLNWVKNADDK